jgi:hypothetical protein
VAPAILLPAVLLFASLCFAAPPSDWRVARSSHFEIYSQAGDAEARATILWLEQLRALVKGYTGFDLDQRPPVRIIAFRSTAEYDPYRVRASSDAYYVGSESRDYIVMAGLGTAGWAIAAHEYAHAVLRSPGAELPLWLREGLAEALATVRITSRGNTVGGDLPPRLRTLQHERWIPLPRLLSLRAEDNLGDRAAVFYGQSWALADLVLVAPAYAPRFAQFVAAIHSGDTSEQAFLRIYGKSAEAVEQDIRQRNIRHRRMPIPLAGEVPGAVTVEFADVTELRARTLIAEVVMLAGDPDHAAALYRDLERDAPNDPDVALGLGTLALRKGDLAAAREHWRRAIANGAGDASLCYLYASLAGMAGVAADDIRPALLRAIELRPNFDDARYSLALLESNAGNHQAAVTQLRAMRVVAPSRAFGYWTALADALTQTGDREGAKAAALRAAGVASTEEERSHAAELAHVAETDFAVRMTRDAQGRPHMVTTRIPHDSADFNPFIEPGDVIERVEGTLREVDCAGAVLRMVVETADGPVGLAIRGLDHVQIRNGPGEFTCGPQSGVRVSVEYAKGARDGIEGDVRGMRFQ